MVTVAVHKISVEWVHTHIHGNALCSGNGQPIAQTDQRPVAPVVTTALAEARALTKGFFRGVRLVITRLCLAVHVVDAF